ncbi:MAG: carbohydrate binding domain-containing protein [Candidatus Omnitrophica bacterium]|nr:carbohydrate binding domain-containing protein [Candidatus Omnitrophota bacterium]
MLKRIITIAIIILFLGVGIYWIKCQAGINISDRFSLSRFRIFKSFQIDKILEYPQPGVIFSDSFDNIFHRPHWHPLWSAEKGNVKLTHEKNGLKDSKCLLITNDGKEFWTYEFIQIIEVKPGDEFYFEGYLKNKGAEVKAGIGITLMDKERNKISYNYVKEEAEDTDDWIKLSRHFTIPETGVFIQFRLFGIRQGKSYFDNILLEKTASAHLKAP